MRSKTLLTEAKSDFDHKTSKIKSHSARASKRYFNDKSLIHGQEQHRLFDLAQKILSHNQLANLSKYATDLRDLQGKI